MVHEHLDVLCFVAETLGIDDAEIASFVSATTKLSNDSLATQRSAHLLECAEQDLLRDLTASRHEEALILKWRNSLQKSSQDQGPGSQAYIERQRSSVGMKGKEYRNELSKLTGRSEQPEVTITQLAAQQERIRKKKQQIKLKQTNIKAFQGLPPDLHLAKEELRCARSEQMKLIQLRERLLGKMVEGVI
ncbi:hypothetical protein JAAARDRAFT_197753 [Jaapia argillacea MUCL 33604]|uniref:Uncharacterized protein n=1 Tax=Jaapia argillacea MUCL 33604 TaxID=933084 RepID=A0A067PDK2_9AGAM|nr:hypothetical protein JAAARDRAFT_197753 [Jaapia argillacea MUCL 33604]